MKMANGNVTHVFVKQSVGPNQGVSGHKVGYYISALAIFQHTGHVETIDKLAEAHQQNYPFTMAGIS